MVDLAPYELKPGEHVRYRLEVRDRKGQTARTVERLIRISTDKHAAEREQNRFEKKQDSLLEKLRKLIAQQEKLAEQIEQLATNYKPLEERVRRARSAAPPVDGTAARQAKPPEIDPETRNRLEQLRPELASAASAEERNSALGRQLSAELAHLVGEAAQLQAMPPEILAEFRATQGAFDRRAAQPLRQLAAEMKQEAAARQGDVPPVADWQQQSKRVAEEMAALAQRLKALEEARRQSASRPDEALAKLRQELLQQQAAEAIRELGPLRAEAAALQKTIQHLEEHQVEQLDAARNAHPSATSEHEQKQEALEHQAAPPLAEAGELLQQQGPQRMKPQHQSADAAHAEEGEEHGEPPRTQDATAATETKSAEKSASTTAEKGAKQASENPEETEEGRRYEPALGGPHPQLDRRLADKRPSAEKAPASTSPPSGEARRDALGARQFQKLTELDTAQQSLGSDVQSLDKLLTQLQQGQAAGPPQPSAAPPKSTAGQPQASSPPKSPAAQQPSAAPQDSAAGKELSQFMQSPALERAMAMAQRLSAARAAARGQRDQPPSSQARRDGRGVHAALGLRSTQPDEEQIEKQLRELDPATRTMLLKMQPRVREELLQGMREEGPEGYRQFIREYFQRLTEVHSPHDH
jgi:hypothetical protein